MSRVRSITLPSLSWIWLTVSELGRLQFSSDRQLSPNFYVFGGFIWGGQISYFILLTPKDTTFARTTYNDVLSVGCVQKCDLWPWRKKQKRTKTFIVQLAIWPDHPGRHSPLKFRVRGRVREIVIYFKFRENRSMGLGAVGSKIALSRWLGPWLMQQLVSYYSTSRD